MGYWIKQTEDASLPKWLSDALNPLCQCGSPKENFYNDDDRCTARRCSNPRCPELIAQRIAAMCELLEISGIKEGRSRELVRMHKLTSHFDALPHILKDKPTINLYTLFRLAFVEGIDSGWAGIVGDKCSVSEVLENYSGKYYGALMDKKEELLHGESLCNIIKPEAKEFEPILWGNVMLTGDILGLKNRDDFIAHVNQSTKGLTAFRAVGKRKTGNLCLIKAKSTPVYGKTEEAVAQGIPIYTPEEFIAWVQSELQRRLALIE